MGYHSIIFLIMMGVPMIVLAYDVKTVKLLKSRRGGCVCLFIDELSAGGLKGVIGEVV